MFAYVSARYQILKFAHRATSTLQKTPQYLQPQLLKIRHIAPFAEHKQKATRTQVQGNQNLTTGFTDPEPTQNWVITGLFLGDYCVIRGIFLTGYRNITKRLSASFG